MPECDYCDASFADEDAHLDHLAADHEGELGPIDRRRVDAHTSPDGDGGIPPVATYAVGGVLALALVLGGGYYVVDAFQSEGPIHEHGTIDVVIDGEQVDFQQQQYFQPTDGDSHPFHIHPGQQHWHMHHDRLTLQEAMDVIDIGVTEHTVTFEGETYDDRDADTSVEVTVNGEPVDPASYELRGVEDTRGQAEGDYVRILVSTGE